MAGQPVTEPGSREAGKLTPRIGLAGDWVIGAANSGPALSLSVTLAAIVAATAYGSGPVIVLCAVPMLIIANAYRRLNAWNANCGAAFAWVSRSISPYLGWLTGWLMIMANLIGNVAAVTVLAPSVLAVAGQDQNARWPNIVIDTVAGVLMIAIAVVGIKLSARTQVVLAVVEYGIVVALAVAATVFWAGHSAGSYPPSAGWLSLTGIGGKGSLSAGLLFAVFMFVGWDGSANVNEETAGRASTPEGPCCWPCYSWACSTRCALWGCKERCPPTRCRPTPPRHWYTSGGCSAGRGSVGPQVSPSPCR